MERPAMEEATEDVVDSIFVLDVFIFLFFSFFFGGF